MTSGPVDSLVQYESKIVDGREKTRSLVEGKERVRNNAARLAFQVGRLPFCLLFSITIWKPPRSTYSDLRWSERTLGSFSVALASYLQTIHAIIFKSTLRSLHLK